ncbi:hypothetical protein TorRG33x02_101850 [Trema orientale]|uniref:Uncharacterized protein n=2 Tax=Cannabaceae TaxID=3481 RepID=A0A2P5AQ81_PARAD|nr:hypothetical protein PanWU01x14_310390 [Parasponia andersonii]PON94146.1 hypothetical protein TorRG33x02_101850 [Trema orientale]
MEGEIKSFIKIYIPFILVGPLPSSSFGLAPSNSSFSPSTKALYPHSLKPFSSSSP